MNIMEARRDILRIADELAAQGDEERAERLRRVVRDKMYKLRYGMKSDHERKGVTASLRDRTKALFRKGMVQEDIAAKLKINRGRVSEILHGYYDDLQK